MDDPGHPYGLYLLAVLLTSSTCPERLLGVLHFLPDQRMGKDDGGGGTRSRHHNLYYDSRSAQIYKVRTNPQLLDCRVLPVSMH